MTRKSVQSQIVIAALCLLACVLAVHALDPAPLERHIRGLRAQVTKRSPRSFSTKHPNGNLHEQFTVTPSGFAYASFDRNGFKHVEWSRSDERLAYESWYTPAQTKERLLDDGRTVSYTSFYKTGRKWEQYDYNKEKRLKSYSVYDKNGHLLKH